MRAVMETPEYPTLDHLDPLDVMMEDKDILGLIDPVETAEMLQSLQDVLGKGVDMDSDPEDVNNNSIVLATTPTPGTTAESSTPQNHSPMEQDSRKEESGGSNPDTIDHSIADGGAAPPSDRSTPTADVDAAVGRRRSTRQIEYNLRTSSILNRIETEQRRKMPKAPKPKNKPPPLSKYRRKTANSRERQRMQEINEAFVELQNAIPDLPSGNAKLTKITTLRLAMNYIASLREMLGYSPACAVDVAVTSPPTSTDSDGMSVSTSSPGQRSGLDSEGESSYSS